MRTGFNKLLIIDNRMRKIEKEKLKQLGYDILEIEKNNTVYEEISSHVDIFICRIGEKLIVEPSIYKSIKDKIKDNYNIERGSEEVGREYPYDIKYNVCTIGKKALHNFEFTDLKLKEELISQGYELIKTNQGYTNCSIAVIDENSAIVSDKGLYKILQKHNIDVLYLQHKLDIKLLSERGYSNRKGFIGGAISKIDQNIIVFGDLDKIDHNNKIREFIISKNLNIIDFKGLEAVDYGGLVVLK